jgi:hypothetical protein
MTFSLLVLASDVRAGSRIFDLAALVVFVSILAHGLTDTAGSNWLAARTAAHARGLARPPDAEPSLYAPEQ